MTDYEEIEREKEIIVEKRDDLISLTSDLRQAEREMKELEHELQYSYNEYPLPSRPSNLNLSNTSEWDKYISAGKNMKHIMKRWIGRRKD